MDSRLIASLIAISINPDASSKDNVSSADIESFLEGPLSIGQSIDGSLVFSSIKKQLELQIRKNRIQVFDLSGKPVNKSFAPDAISQTASIMGGRFANVEFGYQIEIPVTANSGQYIAQHLLAFERLSEYGSVQGQSVVFQLSSDLGLINMRTEARNMQVDKPLLFVSVNISIDASKCSLDFPKSDELNKQFIEYYESSMSTVAKILGVQQ